MARPEKVKIVEEIKAKAANAETLFFTDYKGLTVSEISELRRKLSAQGTEYKILKNTLLRIALAESGPQELPSILEGPTAVAFTEKNSPSVAKLLNDFAVKSKKFTVKAAIMEGSFLAADDVKRLASIPSREVLIAQFVGQLKAPLSKLAQVINNPVQKLAYALDAVAKNKTA